MAKRADITVDFSGVESGGRAIPNGQYLMEVLSVEEKESQEGNMYLAWKWKVMDGPYKGASVYDNTSLKPTALWRLKTLLECIGVDVSEGKMGLRLTEYKGKSALVTIANEKYQGKDKPRITEFLRGVTASKSGPVSTFKKGVKVSFDYEGDSMTGVVSSIEGDTVVVSVEIDGSSEEWELSHGELTVV